MYACEAVNDTNDEMRWNVYTLDQTPTGEPFHMTRPCLHCQNAPCANVCPVGATYQRGDGIVIMDYSRCIGCRYCMVACPYDARRFNWTARTDENPYQPEWGSAGSRRPRGVVKARSASTGSTGLKGLTPGADRAATPACVNICPVGARKFGDVNDPNSEVAKIIAHANLPEDLGTSRTSIMSRRKGW